MDTVDVVPTTGVCPVLLPYEGGPLALQNGDVLAPEQYPGLEARRGKTLIVTNGNTLLGADDKAGIARSSPRWKRWRMTLPSPTGR